MTDPKPPRLRDAIGENGIYSIGLFIVTWNQMEMGMTLIVSSLFRLSMPEAAAVMGGFSIEQKISTLGEALKRASTFPDSKIWAKIPNQIRELNGFRNHVAHGQWTTTSDGHADAVKNLMDLKRMNASDINAKQAELEKITASFDLIFRTIKGLPLSKTASAAGAR